MKEFFGFGGYTREPEGYMSWQHLLFVSSLMAIMITLAVVLGLLNKSKEESAKNKTLIITAILIDSLELFKIILLCFRSGDPMDWRYNLPLFLCSIQLITIPLAAFAKGKIKETSLDFVVIFGLLGAVLGTYAAGNNYAAYPVLSFDNVMSGLTHSISGFAALYIAISGMSKMKCKNLWRTLCVLFGFCIAAYIADITLDGANYMFLMRGDGTPYDIVYNFVGGNRVLYPLSVVALFVIYVSVFYLVYFLIQKRKNAKKS